MIGELAISTEAQTYADVLYNKGHSELDKLIVAETDAKRMFLAGLAMGDGNVLLVGEPGGGKSTLIETATRIIDGIDNDRVAFVPHRADLTAAQLVGDSARSVKTVQGCEGLTTREVITAELESLINPHIQAVIFDEVNRSNPYALNAALGILAQRKMTVDGKSIPMNKLELVAASMNAGETLTASFKLTAALASRQTLGAILGAGSEAERDLIQDKLWDDGWESTPDDVNPVINLSQLHAVRAAIPKVILNDKLRAEGKQVSKNTRDRLRDPTVTDRIVKEADGRIATKLMRITKTLALLRGRTSADEQDLHDAVSYTVTGRLGLRGAEATEIEKVVSAIYR